MSKIQVTFTALVGSFIGQNNKKNPSILDASILMNSMCPLKKRSIKILGNFMFVSSD